MNLKDSEWPMTANTAVNHVELCLIFFNYSCLLVQSLRVEPTSLLAAWAATTAVDPSEFFVSFMLIFVLMFFFFFQRKQLVSFLGFCLFCLFVSLFLFLMHLVQLSEGLP